MASVIFVIAPEKFRDEELFDTREVLESFGIETKIASTIKGKCTGTLGGIANSDYSLNEIDSKDFDAICFIGGGGTPIIRADKAALSLAKEFYKNGKLVCAICWATTILAKAGILDGKKATVWLGDDFEYKMTTDKVLERYGAIYLKEPVVIDQNIITAEGREYAKEFGKKIAEKLTK